MACKQGEKETITEYYGRLKKLWDDLDKYDRNPTCICGGCKYGLNKQLDKRRDESKVYDFLLGIDDSYSTVASNLLLQEPLPSLNRAYATLIQEEGVKGKGKRIVGARTGENRANLVGFAARFSPAMADGRSRENNDKDGDSRPYCDNCDKYGHVRASCFDIIGYPKGWRDRGRGNGAGAPRGGRGGCGGRGGYNPGQGRGNSAVNNAGTSRVSEEVNESKEQFVSVPKEQWDAYVNHAKASSSKVRMNGKTDNNILWLFDSGATHHRTGCFALLHDVKDIDSCMLALPNGKFSKATKEGTVLLGGNLQLKHVLFVPDFNCNLVSIYQLSKDLDCEIKFTNNICVIQDRISKKTIGTGEQKGRLYLLEGESRREVHAANKDSDNVEVLHRRLGHPSRRVVNYLPFINNNKCDKRDSELCDICLRAKQTREKLFVSENKAKSIFELIHCDL
ncbi:uncharacterized protein LOC141630486 [Silene latifolia]|uniref:uncharacterized protein LOC141630486 n=1 Tax=Silene latifolia TaxID=37657 RepID=UPI003D76BBED